MKTQEKSTQAQEDLKLVSIIRDENSSSRDKERAFNDIYKKYEKIVMFSIGNKVKCKDTAEDLRMIAFQKVYENIDKYKQDEGAFSTWVMTIAKNTMIDQFRKANVEVISIDAMSEKSLESGYSEPYQIAGKFATPEDEIITTEEEKRVMKAIGSLKGKLLQELALKRFVDGKKFSEIASEMGVEDNSSLRTKIKRAKSILQQVLIEK